jgi:hypothetical protein
MESGNGQWEYFLLVRERDIAPFILYYSRALLVNKQLLDVILK